MNSFIEQLNRWGETAIPFAAQVLWQTSLLIVVLLALDLLLRRRIRAGFRYALWMLLLVKLVLPPSFALPTGAGYWIDRTAKVEPLTQPPAARQPVEVIYSDATPEPIDFELLQSAELSPAPFVKPVQTPRLTRAGGLLVAWAGGTLLLFAWMLWRWWWVIRLVRATSPAPAELRTLVVGVHALACSGRVIGAQANTADKLKLGLQPDLRLTDTAMSPAVCGLFQPVILLPRKLVERLTTEQLRTVLLHELIHLRRRDLWVNCAQTLLQIAAWWHPLLWVANARIRRVREEAVDETVACALRDDADAYPATLLEVAKLTFTRPLLTLGLVGILESKSALKQRIHRLLELPPLESTRLKWWQWVAVVTVALTALPMAQGQFEKASVVAAEPTVEPATFEQQRTYYSNKLAIAQLAVESKGKEFAALRLRMPVNELWEYEPAVLDHPFVKRHIEELDLMPPVEFMAAKKSYLEARAVRDSIEMKIAQEKINEAIREKLQMPIQAIDPDRELKGFREHVKQRENNRERARAEYEARQMTLGLDPVTQPDQTLSKSEFLKLLPVIQAGIELRRDSANVAELQKILAERETEFRRAQANRAALGAVSPPSALVTTNLAELGRQMITAETPWPDPRFTSYHAIGLAPRFVLVPVENLTNVLDAALSLLRPLVIASNQLSALTNDLIVAGAVDHTTAEPVLFAKVSGGVIHWRVARGEPSLVQFQTQENAAKQSIVFGARAGVPAHVPDWVPLTLLARPFVSTDESLHCLLSFSTGEYHADLLAMAEETIPLGAALVWASTNGVRAGFAQVVILTNTGEPKSKDDAAQPVNQSVKMQNAKVLIELGKFDEAEALLREVAKLDPANNEAVYRLDRIQQLRAASRSTATNPYAERPPAQVATGEGRHKLMEKLNQITLPKVKFEGVLLKDVVQQLTDEARRRDPTGEGINFVIVPGIFNPAEGAKPLVDLGETIIDINPPLLNLKLIDVLRAITMAADQRIKFSVEGFGVVFSPKPPETNQLETRTFRVNPNTFYQGLQGIFTNLPARSTPTTNAVTELAPGKAPATPGGGIRFPTTTNDMSAATAANIAVRDYFKAAGVELIAPKMVYFNDRTGMLMVKATLDDLEIIQRAIEVLNYEPPQITLEVRAVELSPEEVKAVASGLPAYLFPPVVPTDPNAGPASATVSGILTAQQFTNILSGLRLGKIGAPETTGPMRVTTLSGRQTQIKAAQALTVVYSVTNTPTGPQHETKVVELGKFWDLTPEVGADGYTIHLAARFDRLEFLGYDDPAAVGKPPGTPLPVFSVRSVSTKVSIWDGQTLVMGGITIETLKRTKDKVPVLGDIPLLGRMFRHEKKFVETKHVLVFITPTIIDPAGNTVHSPEDMPFAKDAVPQQPTEK